MKFDLSLISSTPCYYYDMDLLDHTLQKIKECTLGRPFKVHYAVKANGEPEILRAIANAGLGADCVSGGEIKATLDTGFQTADICYAGVGKTDEEIEMAIANGIGCLNVESVEELEIISEIAERLRRVANVALRINPNIDAHTHHYITTGLEENKFGIDMSRVDEAVDIVMASKWLHLQGLHFHIGSQITIAEPFALLCKRVNALTAKLAKRGVNVETINVGGGLGIDYDNPDANPIPDFKGFFDTIYEGLTLSPGQEIHCELGRSIVGQCGSLVSKVLYVKKGVDRNFAIIDAGMNDLIRPALYQAFHRIDVLDDNGHTVADNGDDQLYDVVGPVCESADVFAVGVSLPTIKRGTILAIRSAGAYGAAMASTYNMRPIANSVFAK